MLGANVTVTGSDGKNTSILLCVAPSQYSAYDRLFMYANCEPGTGGWVGLHHFGVASGGSGGSGGGVRLDAGGYPAGRALLWGFLRNEGNCGEPGGWKACGMGIRSGSYCEKLARCTHSAR